MIIPNQNKASFKIPSMCDKILFALHSLEFKEFGVLNKLKKSRNIPIFAIFKY